MYVNRWTVKRSHVALFLAADRSKLNAPPNCSDLRVIGFFLKFLK